MKKTSSGFSFYLPALALALAGVAFSAQQTNAGTLYWGTGSSTWATAGNWYTDAAGTAPSSSAPTSTDSIVFNTTPLNGAETVTLAGIQAVTGITINNTGTTGLSGGSLQMGSGGITLNSGAGAFTFGSGLTLESTQTWTNNSTAAFNITNVYAADATATAPITLTLGGTGSFAFSATNGLIDNNTASGGILSLIVATTGNVSIQRNNTYTGGTTIKSGSVSVTNSSTSALGTGAINLGDTTGIANATLSFNIGSGTVANSITVQGGNTGIATLSAAGAGNNITFSGPITLNHDLVVTNTASSGASPTLTFSGVLSGIGGLTLSRGSGPGNNILLTGANTYSGKTTINYGVVTVSSFNSVAGGTASSSLGAPVTVANGTIGLSGANLVYTGTGETTDRVIDLIGANKTTAAIDQSGTGLLKFTSDFTASNNVLHTLQLQGSTSGTGEIAGKIQNASVNATGVTKAGTGTWTLSGANTYTGGTIVNGGTLLINGSTAAGGATVLATTAGINAILGGTGTIGSAVTVGAATGGTTGLSIINAAGTGAIGTLTINGALTFTSTTGNPELAFDLNSSTGTIDKLSITGAVTIGTGTLLVGSDLGNGSLAGGTVLDLLSYTGSLSGTFSGFADGSTITVGSNTYTINYGTAVANEITLTALAVPEPSTWLLLGGGLSVLVLPVLRKRRTPASLA